MYDEEYFIQLLQQQRLTATENVFYWKNNMCCIIINAFLLQTTTSTSISTYKFIETKNIKKITRKNEKSTKKVLFCWYKIYKRNIFCKATIQRTKFIIQTTRIHNLEFSFKNLFTFFFILCLMLFLFEIFLLLVLLGMMMLYALWVRKF